MATPFASKVRYISQELYRHCVQPDAGERVRTTGSLAPKGSLKHRSCREAFVWCGGIHEHRFFTRSAVKTALVRLLDFYELEVPICNSPGLTRADWLKGQAKLIQHLCKRAVKNASARHVAMACLDNVETQVWAEEAGSCQFSFSGSLDHFFSGQDSQPWWAVAPPPSRSDLVAPTAIFVAPTAVRGSSVSVCS